MSDGTKDLEEESDQEQSKDTPGPDEMYCMDCGAIIKERAEICPECGVAQGDSGVVEQQPAQTQQPQSGPGLTDRRQYELEKVASKDKTTVLLASLLISPLGYWMIGKRALAVVNLLTFNFLLMGIIIVPIHCWTIISNAEEELRKTGVEGY
jgi:hypothetical protein